MLNSPGFGGQIDPPQLSLLLPQTVLQSVNADAIMLESALSKSVVLGVAQVASRRYFSARLGP